VNTRLVLGHKFPLGPTAVGDFRVTDASGGYARVRTRTVEAPVTIGTGPFGDRHLKPVQVPVPHDLFLAVAVHAPHPPLCVNILRKAVMIQPVYKTIPGLRSRLTSIRTAVIPLKEPDVVGAHVVLIVTVDTLFWRDACGELMAERIALVIWVDCRIASLIAAFFSIDHVAGCTACCSV
jgi:hypothetical protein